MSAPNPPRVDLSDCADEPIHVPGAIQPHGALLAFESGRLVAWSENAASLLDVVPVPGAGWRDIGLDDLASAGLDEALTQSAQDPGVPFVAESRSRGEVLTRVVHQYRGRGIVEFERARGSSVSHDANKTVRLIGRLKFEGERLEMLDLCVRRIRDWTGFDRVKAYMFQPDGSGEVLAESRGAGVDSFLNMRFPASDIPQQARRLYALNTLRLIPDANYRPVALVTADDAEPIDLSFSTLRSVSPIHVEYLHNMGVRASMSVSIVVGGELWGLFACHHHGPLLVPYSTREACDMVAQFVASRIQDIASRAEARRADVTAALLPSLLRDVANDDDTIAAVSRHGGALQDLLGADGLVLRQQGKLVCLGGISESCALAVASHADRLTDDLVTIDSREDWPDDVKQAVGEWVGMLSIRFDAATGARILAVRRAQTSQVRWAGFPEDRIVTGPLGPRLTPRGSFEAWQETVRGRSRPWQRDTLAVGAQIQYELQRAAMTRQAEVESARRHLLAMLGHDLRDPLHSIRMVAGLLKRDESNSRWGTRIDKSSSRMQRLIAQVLDFSRAEAGLPLIGERTNFDLTDVVDDLVDEARSGHPGVAFALDLQRPAVMYGDRDRIAQALANLISNARHHGAAGRPVGIGLKGEGDRFVVEVRNTAPPIPEAWLPVLFRPLKRGNASSAGNRSGLGLGLYIAERIVSDSGGSIAYRHEGDEVVFRLTLPIRSDGA